MAAMWWIVLVFGHTLVAIWVFRMPISHKTQSHQTCVCIEVACECASLNLPKTSLLVHVGCKDPWL
jgi:hypothetical protein